MRKLRIKELTYENGKTQYIIQTKVLWWWKDKKFFQCYRERCSDILYNINDDVSMKKCFDSRVTATLAKVWLESGADNTMLFTRDDGPVYCFKNPPVVYSWFGFKCLSDAKDYKEKFLEENPQFGTVVKTKIL